MDRSGPLFLTEEVLLLALRDREGTLHGVHFSFAAAGAVLAELLLAGRVRLEGKKQLVQLVSREPLGDEVVDDCLERIAEAKRRGSISTWVSRLAQKGDLKHRVARGLCRKGVLRESEDKVLFLFSRKIYPEMDPAPERAIRDRLRHAIESSTPDVDARTVVLLSLCDKTGILRAIFDKKKLAGRKKRIEGLISGVEVGEAAKKVIQEMEAAILVTTMVPIFAASAT